MNKILFCRAFIAGIATVMQFWLSVVVFNNDFQCRTAFTNSNSSVNQQNCVDTLDSVSEWHCTCEWFTSSVSVLCNNGRDCQYHYTDLWMRVFNDWVVVTASFVFIPVVLIEAWRSFNMIGEICCDGKGAYPLSNFEYCSLFGFLAMVLNPACFNTQISSNRADSLMIIIDCLTIGLVFQYSAAINVSIMTPYMLATLISSSCNGVGYLLNIFLINYRLQNQHARKNLHSTQEKFIDHSVQVPVAHLPLPPPYNNKEKNVV